MAVTQTNILSFPAQAHNPQPLPLLDPKDIVRETAAVVAECKQALGTSRLPADELLGRLRASLLVANVRRGGKR